MTEGPLGYSVEKNGDLTIPYYIENEDGFRDIMTRESSLSFPSAALGTVVAGPAGTLLGHFAGSTAAYIRHRRINPDEDPTEPKIPGEK